MNTDVLVIADFLVEPPTDLLAFRTVTMMAHYDLNMKVLIHTTQEMKDMYYHWMKPRGLMDYVNYMITEFEWEDGIRIDNAKIYPQTIVVSAIRFENQLGIIGRIKSLTIPPPLH